MKPITLLQPGKIQFGTGCLKQFCDDFLGMDKKRLFILTAPVIRPMMKQTEETLRKRNVEIEYFDNITAEPTINDFKNILEKARSFNADSIIGVGGGSVLDLCKLVATILYSDQQIEDLFGTGLVKRRGVWFACIPTTSGTGSEVSISDGRCCIYRPTTHMECTVENYSRNGNGCSHALHRGLH